MATTMFKRAAASNSQPSGFTARNEAVKVGALGGKKKTRKPEMVLGVGLIVLCSLAGLWLFDQASASDSVVAVSADVSQGDSIELSDLEIVSIASTDSLNVVAESDAESLVGLLAVTDLKAGTLITHEQVSGGSRVQEGDGRVGMTLPAGNLPSLSLQPGSVVDVVLTSDDQTAPAEESSVLVRASVAEVAPSGAQGDRFVALSMSQENAVKVAQAVSLNRVHLVEVASS